MRTLWGISDRRLCQLATAEAALGEFVGECQNGSACMSGKPESERFELIQDGLDSGYETGAFGVAIGAVTGDHDGLRRARAYCLQIPKSMVSFGTVSIGNQEIPRALSIEGPAARPYWRALPDRFVVELEPREGPLHLEFS